MTPETEQSPIDMIINKVAEKYPEKEWKESVKEAFLLGVEFGVRYMMEQQRS